MATTTADDTQDEPAEEQQPSLLGGFSQADLRLLLVTFVGTVAANVVTVMVVAAAITIDRPPIGAGPTTLEVLALLGSFVSGSLCLWVGRIWVRRRRQKEAIPFGAIMSLLLLTIAVVMLAFEGLLILLGLAVDVK